MVRILVPIFALEVLQRMQEAIIHVEGDMRVLSPPKGQNDSSMKKGAGGNGEKVMVISFGQITALKV